MVKFNELPTGHVFRFKNQNTTYIKRMGEKEFAILSPGKQITLVLPDNDLDTEVEIIDY